MKKISILFLIIIICSGVILAGTYTWWSSVNVVYNKLQASDTQGLKIYEEFTPTDAWVPGVIVDKNVKIINTNTGGVVARVSLKEIIQLYSLSGTTHDLEVFYQDDDPSYDEETQKPIVTSDTAIAALAASTNGYTQLTSGLSTTAADIDGLNVYKKTSSTGKDYYFAYYKDPDSGYNQIVDIANLDQGINNAVFRFPFYQVDQNLSKDGIYDPADPNAIADHTADGIVLTFGTNVNNDTNPWGGPTDAWYYGGDGYYYYGRVLDANVVETTPLLVSLRLSETAGNQFKNMKYEIDVTLEGVQATVNAVQNTWKGESTNFQTENPAVWGILSPMLSQD